MSSPPAAPPVAASSLFRKKALDRLSSPEQLDHLLETGRSFDTPALLLLLALLAGAVLWALFGSIPIEVGAEGVVHLGGPAMPRQGGEAAEVAARLAALGIEIDRLARESPRDPARQECLRAALAGVAAARGQLVRVAPSERARLVVSLPAGAGMELAPGMEVHLASLATAGPVRSGVVRRVSREAAASRLAVEVALPERQAAGLNEGERVRAVAVLGRTRPLSLLWPTLAPRRPR